MQFCVEKYVNGIIFGFNESYVFDSEIENKCIEIATSRNFSSKNFFQTSNFTSEHFFDSLLEAHLLFTLKTVRFRDLGPLKSPDCYRFDIDVRKMFTIISKKILKVFNENGVLFWCVDFVQ